MASDDRFYLMEMSNRPAKHGDVGSLLRIEGIVVGGGGAQAVLMLPGCYLDNHPSAWAMDVEEWSDFIRRSDNPEILVGPSPQGQTATLSKIFHRKLRYEISGAVQQQIWAADGFKCVYCGRRMGETLLTIDHFIPLELGGQNDHTNYLSACKNCNKDKGSMDPEAWCHKKSHSFDQMKLYIANRNLLFFSGKGK